MFSPGVRTLPPVHATTGAATRRVARLFVVALVLGVGISQLIFTVTEWPLTDAGAYWNAALRLREGEPLYPTLRNTESSDVFRYAPWFAWAWIPLTYVPREVAYALWSLCLLCASAAALYPLVQRRAWLATAFFLPILVGISGIGNVQPLIVAALVLGVERRSGPVWIGIAASLKAFPILFAVTYLGRREWRRAVASALVTVALVAPMLLYDLSQYPLTADAAAFLVSWPALYAAVVAAGIGISLASARTRFGWLASATTVAAALPRFFVYDVTFLLPSVPSGPRHRGAEEDDRTIGPYPTPAGPR